MQKIGPKIGMKPETDLDIKNSFAEAVQVTTETKAYRKRLRESEMMQIVQYKH